MTYSKSVLILQALLTLVITVVITVHLNALIPCYGDGDTLKSEASWFSIIGLEACGIDFGRPLITFPLNNYEINRILCQKVANDEH